MRQPIIKKATRGQQKDNSKPVPAPVRGWNARDGEASMRPNEALWLENWQPRTSTVDLRKGAVYQCTAFPNKVETLMGYNGLTISKLFAATSIGIYDATVAGVIGASVQTITNGRFRHAHFSVLGGIFLLAVNGVDKLQLYDGSTWKSIDNTTTPAITGIATTEFIGINIYAQKVWLVQKASMSVWYLPTKLIAGAATEFPLGQVFKQGGYLMAMTSWTVDGGDGAHDRAVFVSSEGEIAVYAGTDPSSSTDFNLIGVYYIGKPLGRDCFIKYGGDVLFQSQLGLFPLSKALQSATLNRQSAISDIIDSVFSASASSYGGNYGWTGDTFPEENLLVINVPVTELAISYQFVMNTITQAWCLYTGWNAYCWEAWNGDYYFGGSNFVAKAFTGVSDFGTNITAFCRTSYNYFDTGSIKKWNLIQPVLKLSGNVTIGVGLDTDFSASDYTNLVAFTTLGTSNWDAATWDNATWGGDETVKKDWITVAAREGVCAALRLRIVSKDVTVRWSATNFLYERGSSF